MGRENMIEKIYELNYEELDEIITRKIKENKNNIGKQEEKENIQKVIIMKEMYKKGFIDGVNIIIDCIK